MTYALVLPVVVAMVGHTGTAAKWALMPAGPRGHGVLWAPGLAGATMRYGWTGGGVGRAAVENRDVGGV